MFEASFQKKVARSLVFALPGANAGPGKMALHFATDRL